MALIPRLIKLRTHRNPLDSDAHMITRFERERANQLFWALNLNPFAVCKLVAAAAAFSGITFFRIRTSDEIDFGISKFTHNKIPSVQLDLLPMALRYLGRWQLKSSTWIEVHTPRAVVNLSLLDIY